MDGHFEACGKEGTHYYLPQHKGSGAFFCLKHFKEIEAYFSDKNPLELQTNDAERKKP